MANLNKTVQTLNNLISVADDDLGFLRTYAYEIYRECYVIDSTLKRYSKLPLGLKQVYELAIRIYWWNVNVKADAFIEHLQAFIDQGLDINDASLTAWGSNTIYYIKRKLCNRLCETHMYLDSVGIKPTSFRPKSK